MKNITVGIVSSIILASGLFSCRGTNASASQTASVPNQGTFVYRDGTVVNARLNKAESGALYRQMNIQPISTRGGNIKVLQTAGKALEIYCTEGSTFEPTACTISIDEAFLDGPDNVTAVRYHQSKPLLMAAAMKDSDKYFLMFDTLENLYLPSYERNIVFDKVNIDVYQETNSGIRASLVDVSIDVSTLKK